MLLDSPYAEINLYKLALAIPMLLAAALISYISYQFFWIFIPDAYDREGAWFAALVIRTTFLYFSTMTYVFLFKTFITNPGYLPSWLKVPVTQEGYTPTRVVRIYNMRFWMANKIYSFEEFAELPDIEINFNESNSSVITEETTASS